jgi:hypothetical protein
MTPSRLLARSWEARGPDEPPSGTTAAGVPYPNGYEFSYPFGYGIACSQEREEGRRGGAQHLRLRTADGGGLPQCRARVPCAHFLAARCAYRAYPVWRMGRAGPTGGGREKLPSPATALALGSPPIQHVHTSYAVRGPGPAASRRYQETLPRGVTKRRYQEALPSKRHYQEALPRGVIKQEALRNTKHQEWRRAGALGGLVAHCTLQGRGGQRGGPGSRTHEYSVLPLPTDHQRSEKEAEQARQTKPRRRSCRAHILSTEDV